MSRLPDDLRTTIEASYAGEESASQVGDRLGVTRMCVIGVWFRARHAGRISPERVVPTAHTKPVPVVLAPIPAPRPPPIRKVAPGGPALGCFPVLSSLVGAPKAVSEAKPRSCRWPIGEPEDRDFRYCGAPVTEPPTRSLSGEMRRSPYCSACRALARPVRATLAQVEAASPLA